MTMKKGYDDIKVIGVENIDPMKFRVVFEIPGHHFDQTYPKRGSHTFKKREKEFVKHSDGEREYLKRMREMYVDGVEKAKRTVLGRNMSDKFESYESSVEEMVAQDDEEFTGEVLKGDSDAISESEAVNYGNRRRS